jgi:PAS domain S-box-containing protein
VFSVRTGIAVVNHQFALIKREGKWEQIESFKRKETEKTVTLQSLQRKRAEDERALSEEALRVAYEELQVQSEELKESNDALHKSEEHFRSLAENSPDIIMRFDIQNRHVYANPAAAEAYGLSQKEMIGKTHSELGRDSEHIKFWEIYQEIVSATGKTEAIEFDYTSPQGKKYYFDTRIVPELVDSKITYVLVISRDITDLKIAEAKLKETLDNLEKLVEKRTTDLEKAYNSLKESEKGLAEAQRMAHTGNWDWNII